MEIERKFLVRELPEDMDSYPKQRIEQAYLSADPVVRIRRLDDDYILTLKSAGLLARQEVEMPLSEPSFLHLLAKKDGLEIEKTRYKIPDSSGYLIELDVFEGAYKGFCMAEVEFPDMKSAETYLPPSWFGQEVTMDSRFHNSTLSARTPAQVREFLDALQKM